LHIDIIKTTVFDKRFYFAANSKKNYYFYSTDYKIMLTVMSRLNENLYKLSSYSKKIKSDPFLFYSISK